MYASASANSYPSLFLDITERPHQKLINISAFKCEYIQAVPQDHSTDNFWYLTRDNTFLNPDTNKRVWKSEKFHENPWT